MSGPATWFSILVIPYQYYVASIGYQLEQKGDDDGFYTNLFMIIYGLGALLSPLGGALVGAANVTTVPKVWVPRV